MNQIHEMNRWHGTESMFFFSIILREYIEMYVVDRGLYIFHVCSDCLVQTGSIEGGRVDGCVYLVRRAEESDSEGGVKNAACVDAGRSTAADDGLGRVVLDTLVYWEGEGDVQG